MPYDDMPDEAELERQYILDQRAMQLREWDAEWIEQLRQEVRDVNAASDEAPRSNTLTKDDHS